MTSSDIADVTRNNAPLDLNLFADWIGSGERGLSSEAIMHRLTGVNLSGRRWSGIDHPADPADFRRCELLLREVPPARHHFHLMMRDVSRTWARYVDGWDELLALAEQEAPGIFDRHPRGTAPGLSQRMRQICGAA